MISPADLSNAYYQFKQTISLPQSLSYKDLLTKPIPAAIHNTSIDADLPTYAIYNSNLPPSLVNSSSSLSSTTDSLSSPDDEEDATMAYYTQAPTKAHCRDRNPAVYEDVTVYEPYFRTT